MLSFKQLMAETIHPKDTVVAFPHRGVMTTGKVVRYEKGGPKLAPHYVIYHGTEESAKIPPHKVQRVTALDEVYDPKFKRATKTDVHYTGTIGGKTYVVPHSFHGNSDVLHGTKTTQMRHAIVVSPIHVQHNNPNLSPEEVTRVHSHIKDIHGGQETPESVTKHFGLEEETHGAPTFKGLLSGVKKIEGPATRKELKAARPMRKGAADRFLRRFGESQEIEEGKQMPNPFKVGDKVKLEEHLYLGLDHTGKQHEITTASLKEESYYYHMGGTHGGQYVSAQSEEKAHKKVVKRHGAPAIHLKLAIKDRPKEEQMKEDLKADWNRDFSPNRRSNIRRTLKQQISMTAAGKGTKAWKRADKEDREPGTVSWPSMKEEYEYPDPKPLSRGPEAAADYEKQQADQDRRERESKLKTSKKARMDWHKHAGKLFREEDIMLKKLKEGSEQILELSKTTLKSYIKKAPGNLSHHAAMAEYIQGKTSYKSDALRRESQKMLVKHDRKDRNRIRGIMRAADKLEESVRSEGLPFHKEQVEESNTLQSFRYHKDQSIKHGLSPRKDKATRDAYSFHSGELLKHAAKMTQTEKDSLHKEEVMNKKVVNEEVHAYDVHHNGKNIDTIFYGHHEDPDTVKRSLVNHDGYHPNITVKKRPRNKELHEAYLRKTEAHMKYAPPVTGYENEFPHGTTDLAKFEHHRDAHLALSRSSNKSDATAEARRWHAKQMNYHSSAVIKDPRQGAKLEEASSTFKTVKSVLAEMNTRKHFQQVADIIKAHPDATKRQELANHHASIFAKDNPRFSHEKFHAAAGTTHTKA